MNYINWIIVAVLFVHPAMWLYLLFVNARRAINTEEPLPNDIEVVALFEEVISRDPEAFMNPGEITYQITRGEVLVFVKELTGHNQCGRPLNSCVKARCQVAGKCQRDEAVR